MPVQIAGQWYQPIDAKYQPQEIVSDEKGRKRVTVVEPYWTQGTTSRGTAGRSWT